MEKLGWLVCEETSRDGCDISPSIHHFWRKADADDQARQFRSLHSGDHHYTVHVRRETREDAEKYGNYVDAG